MERIGRPYHAAIAWLGSGDETGLREALTTLENLGARAAAAARRRMREVGVGDPAGTAPGHPRRSRRADRA